MAHIIVPAAAQGAVLASSEGLSFWGGVDPATGKVIDAHHPLCGQSLAGKILLMPTSRGSCTAEAEEGCRRVRCHRARACRELLALL